MSVKRMIERAAVASGLLRLMRSRRGGVLVLAYHNIVPDNLPPAGDQSLHLPRSQFAAQLDELRRTCEVVPLDAVFEPPPPAGKPRVAITFDDCYQGAVALGVAELVCRKLPATFFVAPALLDGMTFWWDGLADPDTGLAPAIRDQVLLSCQGRTDAAHRWAEANGIPWHAQSGARVSCGRAGLKTAIASRLITVACHTWSHPNVTVLEPDDLREELALTQRWLADQAGSASRPWITWPYGLSNEAAHSIARAAGYHAAFRVDGGWMTELSGGFALPRYNVPAGLTLDGFRMRIAGLLAG